MILLRTFLAFVSPFLLTAITPASAADLLASIRSDGRLRVAIASALPPFCYYDANGRHVGSDVDTATLLAKDMGVKLEVIRITNSDRTSILHERKADLVISGMSITPERERLIAFSVPYARIAIVIAAPQHFKLSSMIDLNNKNVGALANSSNLMHLVQNAPAARVVQYPENDKLSAGYLAGDFDIMTAPESVVEATNAHKPKHPLVTQFPQVDFDIAIGMPSNEKRLREWINSWVVSNLQNGKLDEIYRRHHGRSLPKSIMPSSEPNRR